MYDDWALEWVSCLWIFLAYYSFYWDIQWWRSLLPSRSALYIYSDSWGQTCVWRSNILLSHLPDWRRETLPPSPTLFVVAPFSLTPCAKERWRNKGNDTRDSWNDEIFYQFPSLRLTGILFSCTTRNHLPLRLLQHLTSLELPFAEVY